MKIKESGSDDIILPDNLEAIADLMYDTARYERFLNPDFTDWNMWLLIDRRPVEAASTQRNSGAHCDGFRMSNPGLQPGQDRLNHG